MNSYCITYTLMRNRYNCLQSIFNLLNRQINTKYFRLTFNYILKRKHRTQIIRNQRCKVSILTLKLNRPDIVMFYYKTITKTPDDTVHFARCTTIHLAYFRTRLRQKT